MKAKSRNRIARLFFLNLIFWLSASFAVAATPAQYRYQIRQAKNLIDVLIYSESDDEMSRAEKLSVERENLKNVHQKFPPSSVIEFEGTSVETQNGWLSEKLDLFEKETDAGRRHAILNEISERLGALNAKVGELEKRAVARAPTKDEDKQKLAEILSRPEYQKPEAQEEGFLHRMWRRGMEWLESVFPKSSPFSLPEGGLSSLSFALQIIIYALVAGFICFLIYRFAPFFKERFRRRAKKASGARVILGETLAADASAQNLFAEAEDLARQGNLRAAIRKGYIAVLCELADRKIIGLARHKTNRDYLRDVRASAELYKNMSGLTGSFERHWYGFASTDAQDWEAFKRQYRETINI